MPKEFLFNSVIRIDVNPKHRDYLDAYELYANLYRKKNQTVEGKLHLEVVSPNNMVFENIKHDDEITEYRREQIKLGLFEQPKLEKEELDKLLLFGYRFNNESNVKSDTEKIEYFYYLKIIIDDYILPAIDVAVEKKSNKHTKEMGVLNEWLGCFFDISDYETNKKEIKLRDYIKELEATEPITYAKKIALEIFEFKNKRGLSNVHSCLFCRTYFLYHYKSQKTCSRNCRFNMYYRNHHKLA
jgi:hypothetical protein